MSVAFTPFGNFAGVDSFVFGFPAGGFNGGAYFINNIATIFYRFDGASLDQIALEIEPFGFASVASFCALYDAVAGSVQLSNDGINFDAAEVVTGVVFEINTVLWSFDNKIYIGTSDGAGADYWIYESTNGIDFVEVATAPGEIIYLVGSSYSYCMLNGVMYSYPNGIDSGQTYLQSVDGFTFTEHVITNGSAANTTLSGVIAFNGSIYALVSGAGGFPAPVKLYGSATGDDFTVENYDCFGSSLYQPVIFSIDSFLYAGLGITNPPLVIYNDIYRAVFSDAATTSGNQGATGGGVNGAGGAVGFSRVTTAANFGYSVESLAYPAGIVAVGNDFGIDLGL